MPSIEVPGFSPEPWSLVVRGSCIPNPISLTVRVWVPLSQVRMLRLRESDVLVTQQMRGRREPESHACARASHFLVHPFEKLH